MKTIGLLGGMSWESSVSYYQALNEGVKAALGGWHSAKVILHSVDFAQIQQLQHVGDWDGAAAILIEAAKGLEQAGADYLLICTNTMHKVAEQIQQQINIPILHIADMTAQQLVADNIKKVGLLGTAFTMSQDFYKAKLTRDFGIEVLVPSAEQQAVVHDIIYNELCLGEIKESSRAAYLSIIDELAANGAQAVILGCTEIALLVEQQHTAVTLYDTTAIHAQAAVLKALS
ncbi:aspartate/glutamate racemase family protein [Gammaproteobacteria bacterium AS21]